MPDNELSPDEVVFLANALNGPLLAFTPLDDPMIVDLLERKLVTMRPDAVPDHSLLDLTEAGLRAVRRDLRFRPSTGLPKSNSIGDE